MVKGARTIRLVFADGTKTTATVASASAARDVATLRPASLPQTLVPATIGGKVQVGGSVLAVGNPLGLADSASAGIVSGLDRRTTTADGTFSGLIQFDAAVNPGSSGGPLLDSTRSVIGIVVSIADPGRRRRVRRHRLRRPDRHRPRWRRRGARARPARRSDQLHQRNGEGRPR